MFIGVKSKDQMASERPYYRIQKTASEVVPTDIVAANSPAVYPHMSNNSQSSNNRGSKKSEIRDMGRISVEIQATSPQFIQPEPKQGGEFHEHESDPKKRSASISNLNKSAHDRRMFSSMADPTGYEHVLQQFQHSKKEGEDDVMNTTTMTAFKDQNLITMAESKKLHDDDSGTEIEKGSDKDRVFLSQFNDEMSHLTKSQMSLRHPSNFEDQRFLNRSQLTVIQHETSTDQMSQGGLNQFDGRSRLSSVPFRNQSVSDRGNLDQKSKIESQNSGKLLKEDDQNNLSISQNNLGSSATKDIPKMSHLHVPVSDYSEKIEKVYGKEGQLDTSSNYSSSSFIKVKEQLKKRQPLKGSIVSRAAMSSHISRQSNSTISDPSDSSNQHIMDLKMKKTQSLLELYGLQGQNLDQEQNESQSSIVATSDTSSMDEHGGNNERLYKLARNKERGNYMQFKAYWIRDKSKSVLVEIKESQTVAYLKKKIGERLEETQYDFYGLRCVANEIWVEKQDQERNGKRGGGEEFQSSLQQNFKRLQEELCIQDVLKNEQTIFFEIDTEELWLNMQVSIFLGSSKMIDSTAQFRFNRQTSLEKMKQKIQIYAINVWEKTSQQNNINDQLEQGETVVVGQNKQKKVMFEAQNSMIDEKSNEDSSDDQGMNEQQNRLITARKVSQLSVSSRVSERKPVHIFNSDEELEEQSPIELHSKIYSAIKKPALDCQEILYRISQLKIKSAGVIDEVQILSEGNSHSMKWQSDTIKFPSFQSQNTQLKTSLIDKLDDNLQIGKVFDFHKKNRIEVDFVLEPFVVANFATQMVNVEPREVAIEEFIMDFANMKRKIAQAFGEFDKSEMSQKGRSGSDFTQQSAMLVQQESQTEAQKARIEEKPSIVDKSTFIAIPYLAKKIESPSSASNQLERSQEYDEFNSMHILIHEETDRHNQSSNAPISSTDKASGLTHLYEQWSDPDIQLLINSSRKFLELPNMKQFNEFASEIVASLSKRFEEIYSRSMNLDEDQITHRNPLFKHEKSSNDLHVKSPLPMSRHADQPGFRSPSISELNEREGRALSSFISHQNLSQNRDLKGLVGKQARNNLPIDELFFNQKRKKSSSNREKRGDEELPVQILQIKKLFNGLKDKLIKLYFQHLQCRQLQILEFIHSQTHGSIIMASQDQKVTNLLNQLSSELSQNRKDLIQAKIVYMQQMYLAEPQKAQPEASNTNPRRFFSRMIRKGEARHSSNSFSDIRSPNFSNLRGATVEQQHMGLILQRQMTNGSGEDIHLSRSKSNQVIDFDKTRGSSTSHQVHHKDYFISKESPPQRQKRSVVRQTAQFEEQKGQVSSIESESQIFNNQNNSSVLGEQRETEGSRDFQFSFGGVGKKLMSPEQAPEPHRKSLLKGIFRKNVKPDPLMAMSFEDQFIPKEAKDQKISMMTSSKNNTSQEKLKKKKTSWFLKKNKKTEQSNQNMPFNKNQYVDESTSLENSLPQVNILSKSSDADPSRSFNYKSNFTSTRYNADLDQSASFPRKSINTDQGLNNSQMQEADRQARKNSAYFENIESKMQLITHTDQAYSHEIGYAKSPINDMTPGQLLKLIDILSEIIIIEICDSSEKKEDDRVTERSSASPPSRPPEMSFNQNMAQSSALFNSYLIKIEEYYKEKEPNVRKFEQKKKIDNFQIFQYRYAYTLLHHCQLSFMNQEVLPNLNQKTMEPSRNRKHIVNLSFNSSLPTQQATESFVKLPALVTVDEQLVQKLITASVSQMNTAQHSAARIQQHIKDQIFPSPMNQDSLSKNVYQTFLASFSPVPGLEAHNKNFSLLANNGIGLPSDNLTHSYIMKMEDIDQKDKQELLLKMKQDQKVQKQKRRNRCIKKTCKYGFILIFILALICLAIYVLHKDTKYQS